MTCPICKKTHKENGSWMRCPKYNAPVCEKHCKNCEYHTDYGGTSVVHCTFLRKQK